MNELYWLPRIANFGSSLEAIGESKEAPALKLRKLRGLANHRLDFNQSAKVDRALAALLAQTEIPVSGFTPLKVAILCSSTIEPFLPSIRIGALRRGLLIECYTGAYNQYRQELLDASSGLHRFKPDVVIFSFHPGEIRWALDLKASAVKITQQVADVIEDWAGLWNCAQQLGAVVIQQNIMIPGLRVFGQLDTIKPATAMSFLAELNRALRVKSAEQGVLVLDLDDLAAQGGKSAWFDPALWHHAQLAISPVFAPLFGDHVGRMLAAIRGLSQKCLVLDLDNTLWGGVVGEEGLESIELGPGSAAGEIFSGFQEYLKSLKERGILLAVCSKNEMRAAMLPFQGHPGMKLRLEDFAVFIANWKDKASNIRQIAARLNIGLEAMVFFDDNPAERGWIREALPDVLVLEAPEDPARYADALSDSGYFEAVNLTEEDLQRVNQYAAQTQREALKEKTPTLDGFLQGLGMQMTVSSFDGPGAARIAQLMNKTNQFNLTTRRYTEAQVLQRARANDVTTFQFRLKDVYGDCGMISVVILTPVQSSGGQELLIDAWLMSCRVFGRQVEFEVLNQIVEQARKLGAHFFRGEYIPTEKNGLVREHYQRMGFARVDEADGAGQAGRSVWRLSLDSYRPHHTHIRARHSSEIA